MFTHPVGYVLFALALLSLAATFIIAKECVLLALIFAVCAAAFERDYPSGF
jgi:hypothetical protein